jgi:heptose-I-phosphate ethanolaminephosphotransferase
MNSNKTIFKIFLSGLIVGIIIQLNWAQGFLVNKGLIACFGRYWLRIVISGICGGVIFLLSNLIIAAINKGEKGISEKFCSFLNCFNVLILYLFFTPSTSTLIFLFLLVPIIYRSKEYLNNIIKNIEFKNLAYIYLIIAILLYFNELLLLIYSKPNYNYIHYFSLLLVPLIYLIIPLLFPSISRIYAIIISIIYSIPAIIANSHIILYGVEMPASTYNAIWETTVTESSAFIKDYASFPIIGINLLLLALIVIVITRIKKSASSRISIYDRLVIISILLFIQINENFSQKDIPSKFITSYIQFKNDLKKYRSEFEFRKNNPLGKQADISCSDTSQTFVLIIGESASKYHQGLYGYSRNTNPLLDSIRDELYVFDSVISPHSHTNPVLAKVLSFANFESMEPLYKKRSLIEYMKDAGYKTYWLSNQQFANEFNTLSTMIGMQADDHVFTNYNNIDSSGSTPIYDGVLLKYLSKALDENTKKKFIVLHLMGSHSDKSKRYPTSFNVFKDTSGIPWRKYNRPWVYEVTNEHDNSVLYNDYVLYQSINLLKNKSTNSIWLYFSDHGEEIFDYRDFGGHSEGNASIYMFDIPFILWLSDDYKKLHKNKVKNFQFYLNRRYQTDDVIHSIIDLSGCYSADYDSTKSIFSPYFKFEKRFISTFDYDSLIRSGKKSITD